jgi:hypothetical protein
MAKKYLEENMLNVGFGVLNPLSDTMSGKYFDAATTTSLEAVKNATVNFYSDTILQRAGRFIGIVLRVDGSTKDGFLDLNSWSSLTTQVVNKNDSNEAPNLLQIRVRIPEVHGYLPVPKSLPDVSLEDPDHDIINMYPVFLAENEELSNITPEPGSLVWVDFQNRANLTGAVYYGLVNNNGSSLPRSGKQEESASDLYASGGTTTGDSEFNNVQTTDYSSDLTVVTLSAAQPIAPPGYVFKKSNLRKLRENRVRRFAYGNCKREGPALVPLPGGAKGHPLLAVRLEALNDLWRRYVQKEKLIGKTVPKGSGNGIESITSTLNVSNGFRDKKAYSLDDAGFRKWCSKVVAAYTDRGYNCRQASVLRAFASPHETGLAIDFSNNGLRAVSKTMSAQAKTPAFIFLVKYAWLFGLYIYNGETWHWEVQVPREAWKTGEEFAGNPKYGELEPLKIVSSEPSMLDAMDAFSVNTFSGSDYDWLAGEQFPYAIWVDEKVKTTGAKTSDSSFAGLRTWKPGAETFRLPRGIGA